MIGPGSRQPCRGGVPLSAEVTTMSEPVLVFPDLVAEAPHVPRGIHSQTLYDGPDLRLVLFAFAPGEELSEHTAARPAVVHVLDGEGDAIVDGEPFALNPGTWFRMPAGTAPVSYTHLRAHETVLDLVCRLLLEKKKKT